MQAHKTLRPIYKTRHYFGDMLVGAIITVVLNYYLDKQSYSQQEAPYTITATGLLLEMAIFHTLLPIVFILSTGMIRKEILNGKNLPVERAALENTWWKKVFLTAEPSWTKRIPLFIGMSFVCPGILALSGVMVFCAVSSHGCTTSDLEQRVLWTQCWKLLCWLYMHAVNYAAAHNASQPELLLKSKTS